MPLIRDVQQLRPDFRDKVIIFLAKLDELGIKYYISETKRTKEVQKCYFAQGRYSLEEVNKLRKEAGLWLITEAENKNKITWTLNSRHIDGSAIDLVPASATGKPEWNAESYRWKQIADIGLGLGLTWGGSWQPPDNPHWQI